MGQSTLLFASPSFWEGVARSIDAGGTMTEFNSSLTPQQADVFALRSDWSAVGSDLWTALLTAQNQLARQPIEQEEATTSDSGATRCR